MHRSLGLVKAKEAEESGEKIFLEEGFVEDVLVAAGVFGVAGGCAEVNVALAVRKGFLHSLFLQVSYLKKSLIKGFPSSLIFG